MQVELIIIAHAQSPRKVQLNILVELVQKLELANMVDRAMVKCKVSCLTGS